MWDCGPGHQRTLRAIVLAGRAHIIADLAVQFAPQVDIAHVFAMTVSHVSAHPGLYEYVRITPPALLMRLVREFDLAGEAFSTPMMTCVDTPSLEHSHFTQMPTFLRGVSVHPWHQTRCPPPFEDQFSDPTPFPHSVLVSLNLPAVTSVAATRFFRKCYATTALGHTVVLVGGFRDHPSNRRIRRVLSQLAPTDRQDAMLLRTFPSRSFPAGTATGWHEPPEGSKQEHPKFSLHMRFGVFTQPSSMDPGRVNRHANLAVHPCNTRVILFSHRPSARAAAITPDRAYHLTSILHGTLVPHQTRGDRFPLLWRGWPDSFLPLRLHVPLRCTKLCMWERDVDVAPLPPPPLDDGKSPMATARRQLFVLHDDVEHPFPKHVIHRDFVGFLRAQTHVPAPYAAMAAVAIVRAGLGGQFTLERARAAMLAYVLRTLHFHTPQSRPRYIGATYATHGWCLDGASPTHIATQRKHSLQNTHVLLSPV